MKTEYQSDVIGKKLKKKKIEHHIEKRLEGKMPKC